MTNFDSIRSQCLHLDFHCPEFPTNALYFQTTVSKGLPQKELFDTNSDFHVTCWSIDLRPVHNYLNLVFAFQDVVDWRPLLLATLELLI